METNELGVEITDVVTFNNEEVYTESFRAGKRTYFFDVKKTKNAELYITITESKRKLQKNGKFAYDKHQIYLYKEDFDRFVELLTRTVSHVKENQPCLTTSLMDENEELEGKLTPILDFEDLDK